MNKRASLLIVSVVLAASVYLANAQAPAPPIVPLEVGRFTLLNGRIGTAEVTFRIDSCTGAMAVLDERLDAKTGGRVPVLVPVRGTPAEEQARAAFSKQVDDLIESAGKAFQIDINATGLGRTPPAAGK